MLGKCQLCNNHRELRDSHIIPKFVFNWLKETSPAHIRVAHTPNRRVQDGVKAQLLCDACELLFSKWENIFKEEVFDKIHSLKYEELVQIPYNSWALKFAVSVSWRILLFYKANNLLSHLSDSQSLLAEEALMTWQDFLLGKVSHPDGFVQHIIPTSLVNDHNIPNKSTYINRYLLRTVDMDVACSDNRAFVYAKLGRIILFGLIQEPYPDWWSRTKIHSRKGLIGGRKFVIPTGIDEYIVYKANRLGVAYEAMSERQQEIVRQVQESQEYSKSQIFDAFIQDFLLSNWYS